jgi:hypothetical protein
MLTVIVIMLYAFVILFDFIPRRKERPVIAVVVYCAIMAVSFMVLILYSLGIQVPGPSEAIENMVNTLVKSSR